MATCFQSVGLVTLDLTWIWEFHSSSFGSSYQRETSKCWHQRVLVCTWIVHSFRWAPQHCALESTAAGKTMRCPLHPCHRALGLTSNDLWWSKWCLWWLGVDRKPRILPHLVCKPIWWEFISHSCATAARREDQRNQNRTCCQNLRRLNKSYTSPTAFSFFIT